MLFWMLLNNGVLTNKERNRRRLSETESCNMCGHGVEGGLHMLRDCTDALRTWNGILRYGGKERFCDLSLSLKDWLIQNISSKRLMGSGLRWSLIFGVGCWHIRKKRCDFVFKGIRRRPEDVIMQIINMAKLVEEARIMDNIVLGVSRSPILVGWRPPSRDTLKLNMDASLEGGTRRTFGGGLFRDDLGVWRYGFVANVGKCSILTAELWCILYGLKLAKELGFRKLEVESDNFVGVSMILGRYDVSINCRAIVQKVRSLIQELDSVVIHHVNREENFAADYLSHFAYGFGRGLRALETTPLGIYSWLTD